MKKLMVPRAAVLWLFAGAISANGAERSDRKTVDFGMGIAGGFDVVRVSIPPVRSVSEIPEAMRMVPIHPADTYKVPLENNGPIPGEEFKLSFKQAMFKARGGLYSFVRIRRVKVTVEGGVLIPLMGDEDLSPQCGEVSERDYLGNPGSSKRGEGTALTYYGLLYRRTVPYYYLVETEWHVSANGGSRLVAGMRESPYELMFERGWDRYDDFEIYHSFRLGTFRLRDAYLGFSVEQRTLRDWGSDYRRLLLTCGVAVPLGWERASDEGMKVHLRKYPFYFQISFAYGVDLFARMF